MNKTSDWAAISRASGLLCDLVQAGHGLIPKQQKLHNQFVEWLSYRCNETWKYKESDGCILRLRAMLQSLLSRKRDGQGAPRNYLQLHAIMDDQKMAKKINSSKENKQQFLHQYQTNLKLVATEVVKTQNESDRQRRFLEPLKIEADETLGSAGMMIDILTKMQTTEVNDAEMPKEIVLWEKVADGVQEEIAKEAIEETAGKRGPKRRQ